MKQVEAIKKNLLKDHRAKGGGQYGMFILASPMECEIQSRSLRDDWNEKPSVFFSDNLTTTYPFHSRFPASTALPESQID